MVHGTAILLTLGFGANELKIVAFYAISVLVGFLLSLSAAVKFAFYTRTYYLMLAIPGLLMVAFALVVNMGRYEGWVIIGLGIVMAYYLRKSGLRADACQSTSVTEQAGYSSLFLESDSGGVRNFSRASPTAGRYSLNESP